MIGLCLLGGFMLAEIVVGLLAGSLALIADAGHMLTDAGAIGLALVSMRLAERPPEGNLTFGLKRIEILSAQANGITLLLLAACIVCLRRHQPPYLAAAGRGWIGIDRRHCRDRGQPARHLDYR